MVGFAEGSAGTGQRDDDVAVSLCVALSHRRRQAGDFGQRPQRRCSPRSPELQRGLQVLAFDGRVLDNGKPPIMLEPVKATIAIAGRPIAAVNVLDHDGKRTGRTVGSPDGAFTIDGGRDKAFYYEVVFAP